MPATLLTLGIQMGIQKKRQIQDLLALTVSAERQRNKMNGENTQHAEDSMAGEGPASGPGVPPPPGGEVSLPNESLIFISTRATTAPGEPLPCGQRVLIKAPLSHFGSAQLHLTTVTS